MSVYIVAKHLNKSSWGLPHDAIQGGSKKWYLSYITLHCTRGITFFGPPCMLTSCILRLCVRITSRCSKQPSVSTVSLR